ncbi:hypothetical protein TNCV_2954531 [Trichonephila clavipes]|nr:hypothetical protein TNCV_2954531 [Trichonephila clavipes]
MPTKLHNTSRKQNSIKRPSVRWSSTSLIHPSFLKTSETIAGDKYCNEIDEMLQKLAHKQPEGVKRSSPILLNDNARSRFNDPSLKVAFVAQRNSRPPTLFTYGLSLFHTSGELPTKEILQKSKVC